MTNKKNAKLLSPIFYEKSASGEESIANVDTRLIKDRVIYIHEAITEELASTVTALLFMLNNENSEDKISLWITSPGGLVTGLFQIYDMIQMIDAPVETICLGEASSAAAILLAAGAEGSRAATKNSQIMIHQVSAGTWGNIQDMNVSLEHSNKLNNKVFEILSAHSGVSVDTWKELAERDLYLSAEEALQLGVIDVILENSPAKKRPGTKRVRNVTRLANGKLSVTIEEPSSSGAKKVSKKVEKKVAKKVVKKTAKKEQ